MRVVKLCLQDFRNYESLQESFAENCNIIKGQNAQGKTNLLEAIYLCSCARSHRTGKDVELVKNGAQSFSIILSYIDDNRSENTLAISYDAEKGKRLLTHNGLKIDKLAEFFGLFHAVIFAPEDVMLVKEGPAGRRRFLDILISKLSPSYFRDLQLYQRILEQRNHLLKNLRERNWRSKHSYHHPQAPTLPQAYAKPKSGAEQLSLAPEVNFAGAAALEPALNKLNSSESDLQYLQLDIWTDKLVDCAARIIKVRANYVKRLEEKAAAALLALSSSQEELEFTYKAMLKLETDLSLSELKVLLKERYERNLAEDCLKGSTNQGPHRDDLEMALNGVLIRPYASQGQQRSVVLALKLAELALIEEECGQKAVLLLDDVLSELDQARQQQLLSVFAGHQVFLSCTDSTDSSFFAEASNLASANAHYIITTATINRQS